jgi:hypothetical protein
VAIVCALPIELAAVCVIFDQEHSVLTADKGDASQYAFGRIGKHNVVVACLPKGVYGQVSVAVVAAGIGQSYPHIQRCCWSALRADCPPLTPGAMCGWAMSL